MSFSDRHPTAGPGSGWIGVALRSQHFFANYGHLVYLRPDGTVWHTRPRSESEYEDIQVGQLQPTALQGFVSFDVKMTDRVLALKVGTVRHRVDLTDRMQAPFVRTAGKIRLQTYRCRAVLGSVHVEVTG
jgi:hypothetical protein